MPVAASEPKTTEPTVAINITQTKILSAVYTESLESATQSFLSFPKDGTMGLLTFEVI